MNGNFQIFVQELKNIQPEVFLDKFFSSVQSFHTSEPKEVLTEADCAYNAFESIDCKAKQICFINICRHIECDAYKRINVTFVMNILSY